MKSDAAVAALSALAHESRLAVFRLLVRRGPQGMVPGDLVARLKIPPATLSFHLKELSAAGLVDARREGRSLIYTAQFGRMNQLLGFLTDNCCAEDPTAGCAPLSKEPSPCCSPQGEKP